MARKHIPLGVNAPPEFVALIDKRCGELDLSRAQYFRHLAKMDIEFDLLPNPSDVLRRRIVDGAAACNFENGQMVKLKGDADPTEWCRPTRRQLRDLEAGIRIEEVSDCGDGCPMLFLDEGKCPYVLPADMFEEALDAQE